MISPEKRLTEIISKVLLLDEKEINDNISRKDVESWDSLAHLMLINEVESAFNVFFGDEDTAEIETIGDLKQKLRKLEVKV
jgi:acyl carrier protein